MLIFKLIVCALILVSGILARDTRRGNIRHRQSEEEYKYNHPPVPDNYEAIPVAIVYEDQGSREDKSIRNDVTLGNHVKDVNKDLPKSEPTTQEPNETKVVNDDHVDSKLTTIKQEEPKPTTYRPQKEHQIPVAVVYEPERITYKNPSRNNNRGTNNRRKIQRPALEDKGTNDDGNISSNAQVNGHIGTDSIPIAKKSNEFNRRQRIPRPATEQTIVEDNTFSSVQKNIITSSIPLSDKPEEQPKKQMTQTTKNIETTVETNTPSIPTENHREVLSNKGNSQHPVPKQKEAGLEDTTSTGTQVFRNRPSVPKPERTETIKTTENTLEYIKRGNSTRVREVIPIVQSENLVFSQSGNFKYSYEGGDGTKAFEKGELKTFDNETAGEAVSGGFSYTAKDGNEYSLSYTADENGYRPVGAHLPTPPPIPPAIARALAYLATKTTPEPVTESIAEYDQ